MFNNAPGSKMGDSMYRAALRHAVAAREGRQGRGEYHAIEILWDLAKAFDKVDRSRVSAEGHRLGYPIAWLRLSLGSYSWKRSIAIEGGIATEWLQAQRRIAPRSAFAVYELKLAVHEYITEVVTHPLNCAVLRVDDTVLRFAGSSFHEIIDAAVSVEVQVN